MKIELNEGQQQIFEQAFALPEHDIATIECHVGAMTKLGLEEAISFHGGRRETGLKRDLQAAIVSGDEIEIGFQSMRAQEAARRGVFLRAARRAVTIENENREKAS